MLRYSKCKVCLLYAKLNLLVLSPSYSTMVLATHEMSLDDAPRGYDMFKHKKDGCVRVAFRPHI